MKAQTPFQRVLERIGESNLVELFGRRVHRTTIANWKTNRYPPPAWAIDRLRQRWQEIDAAARRDLETIAPGPGLRAGAKNLAAYLARRR